MTVADSDFHPLWLQDLEYPARLDRVFADNIWTEGILGGSSFAVSPSSPAAMTVDVAAGVAVVEGDDQTAQGKYLVRKQTAETGLVIGAAPGSGQRNDLIVLQVRDPNAGGAAGDDAVLAVIAGTPSGSPVDPAVPNTALVLARVRVPAGTGSITAGLIDDLRVVADPEHDVLGVPAGTIVDTLRDTAPDGWVFMQGQTLTNAQTVYPALWAALPSAFKSGSDVVLPDLRGRVTLGAGTGSGLTPRTLGASGGAETHTLTSSEMPVHSHGTGTLATNTTGSDHTHTLTGGVSSGGSHTHGLDGGVSSGGGHTHVASSGTQSANHNHGINNSPPSGGGVFIATRHDTFQPFVNPFFRVASTLGGDIQLGWASTTLNNSASHSHPITVTSTNSDHSHGDNFSVNATGSTHSHGNTFAVTSTNSTHTHGVTGSTGNAGSSSAHNIMQPFVVTNKMIRVR